MKGVVKIEMGEKEAEEAYQQYLEVVKTRKDKYLQELKKVYYNLKQGKTVVDIYEAMKKAGLNKEGYPRLAICRADAKQVYFQKQAVGSGAFSHENFNAWNKRSVKFDVSVPSNTFPQWAIREDSTWAIANQNIKSKVPIVPAHLLPNGKLENYHILWETKEWESIPEAKDPFLLKRLSNNLFVVLAEWDVTKLEQSIIRGR